jgi:hypothetical protein
LRAFIAQEQSKIALGNLNEPPKRAS